ncbi:type III polyketide synthase [Planctomicrobium piriforme]|uniref:Predicted naringenin-chalcone synthase n=1 Tax=Planctomicrobium piriforme TaxID=1576369 RepID=A0A1I3FUP4_9PLAN|nr:type III polyketide synthase [Planctomicrobium piriforme]SFI14960.1 Predicted naringenin-chalcone synthase [Planctomicrobium piriforme]
MEVSSDQLLAARSASDQAELVNGSPSLLKTAGQAPDQPVRRPQAAYEASLLTQPNVTLAGLSTAVPEHSISQIDAAQLAVQLGVTEKYRKSLDTLYRRSGVERRHSVLLETSSGEQDRQSFYSPASPENERGPSTAVRMERYESEVVELGTRAAAAALEKSGLPAEAITHLVTVSCSGFAAPGLDLALFDRLGLPGGVERAHVGFMGCHGALNGLRVARGWAANDPTAKVLVCAVELCSLHHQYTENAQQLVANALFSDGAAAFILQQSPQGESGCRLISQASYVIPKTGDMMSWKIADHGFQMTLSPKVPEIIMEELKPWMTAWLARHDLTIADIQSWAVHPGGPRILTATAESLDLPTDVVSHSEAILASHGNMSSPTVLFILQRIQQMTERGPTVMLGFGPGLTIEAALLDW